jgi:hypothetical protein
MDTSLVLLMLGVAIGFMGIMLVLSLMVTIINQQILSLMGARSKCLQRALGGLLDSALREDAPVTDTEDPPGSTEGGTSTGQTDAKSLLAREHAYRGAGRWARTCTSIELDEMEDLLTDTFRQKYDLTKIRRRFSRMERAASQQFQAHAHAAVLIISVAVAFLLQVSTPELLVRLSTDDAFRAEAEAAALRRLAEYEGRQSLSGDNARTLMQNEVDRKAASLALLNITPWNRGMNYYYKTTNSRSPFHAIEWAHIVGVLCTALLISLGAPFWYNRLRDAASLRDVLTKRV